MSKKTMNILLAVFLFACFCLATDSLAEEPVESFAIRTAVAKEGVTPADIDKFYREFPSLEGVIPGVKFANMVADRGVNKGKYLLLVEFESLKASDFYFPEGEEGLLEAWMKASNGLIPRLVEEGSKYLVPNSGNNGTDYVAKK